MCARTYYCTYDERGSHAIAKSPGLGDAKNTEEDEARHVIAKNTSLFVQKSSKIAYKQSKTKTHEKTV